MLVLAFNMQYGLRHGSCNIPAQQHTDNPLGLGAARSKIRVNSGCTVQNRGSESQIPCSPLTSIHFVPDQRNTTSPFPYLSVSTLEGDNALSFTWTGTLYELATQKNLSHVQRCVARHSILKCWETIRLQTVTTPYKAEQYTFLYEENKTNQNKQKKKRPP